MGCQPSAIFSCILNLVLTDSVNILNCRSAAEEPMERNAFPYFIETGSPGDSPATEEGPLKPYSPSGQEASRVPRLLLDSNLNFQ